MRRVVCAAVRDLYGHIVLGPRHFDSTMRSQMSQLVNFKPWEQGFLDTHGAFLTREQAWAVAEAAGQIIHRVGGDGTKLFSENLY